MKEGQVFFWYPLIRAQAMFCLMTMQQRSRRIGFISSGILFNTSLLFLVCSLPEARSWIERILDHQLSRPYDPWFCVLFWIWFVGLVLFVLAQCFAEKRSDEEPMHVSESPNLMNSFVNRITLIWFSRLVWSIFRRLPQLNLFELDKLQESTTLSKAWNKHWTPKMKSRFEF
jgi:hypothetical protein